jgi:hypothetical protein
MPIKYNHRNSTSKREPHSYCLSSEECVTPALCIEKRCICPEGTTESKQGNCVYQESIVKPGAWCEPKFGVICQKDASCLRNVCVCNYGIKDEDGCNPSKFDRELLVFLKSYAKTVKN